MYIRTQYRIVPEQSASVTLYLYKHIFPPRYGSLHPSYVMYTVLFEYK